MLEIIKKETNLDSIENPPDDIEIGQWYWVKKNKNPEHEDLMCVTEIGSNYIRLEFHDVKVYNDIQYRPRDEHYSDEIMTKDFDARCRLESNWQEHFKNKAQDIQKQIQQKTELLLAEGKRLCLITAKETEKGETGDNLLPSTLIVNPLKYKTDLIEFKKDRMPAIQREIEALAIDFAMTAKNLGLSAMSKVNFVRSKLANVEDKIFTIELYAGIQEEILQIADGNPGNLTDKITIRQQLLFMDEETLINFNDGGMDYQNLSDFDKWIVKPENLNNILPEPKGIVAFRVRRHDKKREPIHNIWEAFKRIAEEKADMETYLLIRNGEKVFRIATSIDFSPRLIPFENEIGEKQFIESYTHYDWDKKEYVYTETKITPDDIEYDRHIKSLEEIIKQYNRIFIVIQGLLDRSAVFHPHPAIKLSRHDAILQWINVIRDEETGLPNNTVTYEEFRDQLNKSLRKGKFVYSTWYPNNYGRYRSFSSDHASYSHKEYQVINRPKICEVEWVSKDLSTISIKWEAETAYWNWQNKKDNIVRHLEIPTKEVFNVSDYTPGDFKIFLCDRSLKGKYLDWAPQLLNAELYKKGKHAN